MKTALTLLLCLSLLSIFPLPLVALPQQGEASVIPLTNKDVLDMFRSKLGDDVIISKINSSRCHFDTVPSMLGELKQNGVSDAVIRVMIEAPYGMPKQLPVRLNPSGALKSAVEVNETTQKIPDGTEIEVALTNNVSGQEANVGDIVDFTVLRPVQINGVTVFDKGASARGRVTTSKKSGHWGKAG